MKRIFSILVISVMICSLFAIPAAASTDIPYDKMTGLYNMVDSFKDEVSGKAGTLMNGASLVNDAQRGSVLYLNNADADIRPETDGQWAQLAENHIPDGDTMTISFWYKAPERREWDRIFSMGDDTNTRFLVVSQTNGSNFIATLNCNDGAGYSVPSNRDRAFGDEMPQNEWIHVVYVIDPKSGKPNMLYLNGKSYESVNVDAGDPGEPATFSPKDLLNSPNEPITTYLGRSHGNDPMFNGYLSDVVIFDAALTAAQVDALSKVDFSKGDPSKAAAEPPATQNSAANDPPANTPNSETQEPAFNEPSANTLSSSASSVAPKTGDATTAIFAAMILISTVTVFAMRKKIIKIR